LTVPVMAIGKLLRHSALPFRIDGPARLELR